MVSFLRYTVPYNFLISTTVAQHVFSLFVHSIIFPGFCVLQLIIRRALHSHPTRCPQSSREDRDTEQCISFLAAPRVAASSYDSVSREDRSRCARLQLQDRRLIYSYSKGPSQCQNQAVQSHHLHRTRPFEEAGTERSCRNSPTNYCCLYVLLFPRFAST